MPDRRPGPVTLTRRGAALACAALPLAILGLGALIGAAGFGIDWLGHRLGWWSSW